MSKHIILGALCALITAAALVVVMRPAQEAEATDYAPGNLTDAYVREWALHAEASPSTATQTQLIAAPGAGKRIYVISVEIQSEGTQQWELENGSTDLTANMEMADGDDWTGGPYRLDANTAFNITTSQAVILNVSVTYVIK